MSQPLRLTRRLGDVVRAGHPWVFSDAVTIPKGARTGDVVDLVDVDGAWVARGTIDVDTPLTFRSWTTRRDEVVDAALVSARVAAARDLRRDVLPHDVSGYRLVHGENDYVPGLHCDVFAGVASIRSDGPLGAAWEQRYVAAVREAIRPRAVVARNRAIDDGAARLVHGTLPDELVFREGGRRFEVDVLEGQKTGFFVDQRENRDRVASISRGKSVLNAFAYTGGFSVAAALAGARGVTTLDISRPAVDAAVRNFALNGLAADTHELVVADAFDYLSALVDRGERRFDVIVLDPPSFAPRRSAIAKGTAAYRALNEMAIRALPVGGWLATASCSSHIRGDAFVAIVAEAAQRAGRQLAVAGVWGAGPDHPRRLGFADGDYLDFVLARVQA
ncbi:MAG: class I SAM-dependent rRNA methyltransferase [Myxococcales bacterium]|nr:class I SAM-dependent rRNA methyltransferase [Myxococcales bacterium]